eukprot:CAMPEP_0171088534 /NCGR_PEP_ID=MMETSP0766_2-20121228/20836_1 /TAXON_ID=439317 /ORGANISM="Gambierdiscus australes, Strain CAWD 149" /LENGTH=138 /DNA_ID=CAMNT_0011546337 /DNA_START=168 /DNA_END=584 /DNA_ORIENTATION=-
MGLTRAICEPWNLNNRCHHKAERTSAFWPPDAESRAVQVQATTINPVVSDGRNGYGGPTRKVSAEHQQSADKAKTLMFNIGTWLKREVVAVLVLLPAVTGSSHELPQCAGSPSGQMVRGSPSCAAFVVPGAASWAAGR